MTLPKSYALREIILCLLARHRLPGLRHEDTLFSLQTWTVSSRYIRAFADYAREAIRITPDHPIRRLYIGHLLGGAPLDAVTSRRTDSSQPNRARPFCCEVCERNPTCGSECGSCGPLVALGDLL